MGSIGKPEEVLEGAKTKEDKPDGRNAYPTE